MIQLTNNGTCYKIKCLVGECLFQLQFVNSKISVVYFECKKIHIYI